MGGNILRLVAGVAGSRVWGPRSAFPIAGIVEIARDRPWRGARLSGDPAMGKSLAAGWLVHLTMNPGRACGFCGVKPGGCPSPAPFTFRSSDVIRGRKLQVRRKGGEDAIGSCGARSNQFDGAGMGGILLE
jgi:hypothetical protein